MVKIKGITVEIGGDTTRLSKALQGVNKDIKSTQTQLKDVEKLLKLDPSNLHRVEYDKNCDLHGHDGYLHGGFHSLEYDQNECYDRGQRDQDGRYHSMEYDQNRDLHGGQYHKDDHRNGLECHQGHGGYRF